MILALLLLPVLLVTANPFHKYPYVFLLDIGNEELEKVNTEQIRLSSAGGSVALRHPAIGDGDDIAHIRVSSIDFGTDLKANVVEGGPGYKYVVIVLMGNPDVAYEAVITIQTVPDAVNDASIQTVEDNYNGNIENDIPKTYQVSEDDINDSAEDFNDNDESESSQISDKKEEFTQESANVYSYAQNEGNSDYDNEQNDGDLYNSSDGNDQIVKIDNEYDPNEESDDSRLNQASDTADEDYSQDSNKPIVVDQSLYEKYKTLKDHLFNGVYPQGQQSDLKDQNYDDIPVAIENVYNDYEDNENYRDANNNFIDIDESAVEQR